ncbi:unnamed protein product [Parnassius apollo]|uniref:(apollo) hypothetical protein n=1 Tax=Parnassius apollo TaxID=110799 RepID=A0A8S3WS34_PARAO|nr:unnamed protein product [Parnassius apollo]
MIISPTEPRGVAHHERAVHSPPALSRHRRPQIDAGDFDVWRRLVRLVQNEFRDRKVGSGRDDPARSFSMRAGVETSAMRLRSAASGRAEPRLHLGTLRPAR